MLTKNAIFKNIKLKGTVYVSKDYSKAAKTINYVALINSHRKNKFIAIRYFIHVDNVFFIGNEWQLTDNASILPQLTTAFYTAEKNCW